MKHQPIFLVRISLLLLVLASVDAGCCAERESEVPGDGKEVVMAVPRSARFDLKEIADGHHVLVGRLGLRRQFLGTRATPSYRDLVQFHCFNGEELKFSGFTTPGVEDRLAERLADGRQLPVMMSVRFERVRVGHDGINMSERLVARILECEEMTAESIRAAAGTAGFDAAACESFTAALAPDLVKDGVAISLGDVFVRSKPTPRAAAVGIHGVRVFNTSSVVATVEITGLTIEQAGVSQRCVLSERWRAPRSWKVEAGGWSDGKYEEGKMPQTLWRFDPAGAIEPGKKVEVRLEVKLNGGEPVVLTRSVDPV